MKRFLLFAIAIVCVSIGMRAADIPGGGSYTVSDGVVTFSGTTAGAINQNWNALNFSGATRIKFDNTCSINQADLERFFQGNTYYVDLFDITNGTSYDQIISNAVNSVKTSGGQAKGLILPYNTGIGTSATELKNSSNLPTFSEYVAYYRSGSKVANIYVYSMASYYYKQAAINTNDNNTQSQLDAAIDHLMSHSEVTDSESGAEIFMVGTNNVNKFDLSNLPTGKTTIEIVGDEWVKEANIGLADIYVFASEAGHLHDAVSGTGVAGTPCNKFVVSGPVNNNDVKSINDFNDATKEGPKVYNLNETTGAALSDIKDITNSKLEYIVLPNSMATEQIVASDFSDALTASTNTTFKAAIATSADKKKLSAYVKEAGVLGWARYYVTDGSFNNNLLTPNNTGLTDVILSGSLNAADICVAIKNSSNPKNDTPYINADGHWSSTYAASPTFGLNNEYGIKKFDLTNAIFENQEDMNFWKASHGQLTSVMLPTSEEMDLIPDNCLYNNQGLTELCVPYNYKYIRSGAFWETRIDHITTTDASGVLIDNGDHTWTLSANVQELGTKPSEDGVFVNQVFQHDLLVTDIYILATKTPKCYAGVFPANASYGYGGASGSDTYCRDRYFNSEDRQSKAWIVLRFPSEESYNAAKAAGQATDATYAEMKANYTDPTRVYTKKEQTGAVDANGDEITWPTRQEANRSYNQGSRGLTWLAWDPTSGTSSTGEDGAIAGGATHSGANTGSKASMDGMPATTSGYTFNADYMGWHQIALAQATYYEPAEKKEGDKIIREYEEAGLYTFCIPFNMTYEQVVEWLGVPKSTDKVINRLKGEQVDENIMPEIHQLISVEREKGTGGKNNVVTFRLTKNLFNYNNDANSILTYYLDINNSGNKPQIRPLPAQVLNAGQDDDAAHNPITLLAGRPYVIKAYKRVNFVNGVDEFKISGQNIAKMIMTRYADQFELKQSAVENGLYEQLGNGELTTLRFAIPYEGHKIQAMKAGGNGAYLEYTEDGKTHKYYYTMVGQYWEQPLPLYSIYMARGKWYRYTDASKGYKWDPYKCVIMATQELEKEEGDKHYGGGYRRGADDEYTNYPQVEEGTTDLIKTEFKLGFLDGRDDDDFEAPGTYSKYMFTIDDDIVEIDDEGNESTAIKQLDGVDLTIQPDNCKVYNMSGQYVGNSLNGLGKGMYIVNGKKYVVK